MPELDGYEATMEIRRREQGMRRIPIVALTAKPAATFDDAAVFAGCSGFIAKPIDTSALLTAISHWLLVATKQLPQS